jgi:putative transposase
MTISVARHQFPPAIIRHAVWLYVRFTLRYRDVEDLLAERGLDISYETVRRWVLKFGPCSLENFAIDARGQRRGGISTRWLWSSAASSSGAVDDEGEGLDLLVQRRRDKAAAVKLMRKLLTDKLRSYGAANSGMGLSARAGLAPE